MMQALLRRDPAVRSLPKWAAVGALTASAIAGMRIFLATRRAVGGAETSYLGDDLLLALALWIPVAMFLAFGNAGLRCNRFDLALPLPASRLNAAHHGAVLLCGSIVLALAAGVVRVHDWVLVRLPGETPVEQAAPGEMLLFAAIALILAAAALLSVQPTVYRTPSGRPQLLFVTTCLLGGLGLILLLNALPLAVTLLPLAVAAALTVRSFRALPSALTLVPLSAAEDEGTADVESWAAIERPIRTSETDRSNRVRRSARISASIYRTLMLGIAPGQLLRVPVNFISIPFLGGMGLVLSGIAFENPIRLTNVTLTAYMLLAFLAASMAQLHVFDPLPISRRRLFAVVMLPGLLAVALGYGAGRLGTAMKEEQPAILFTSATARNHAPPFRSESPTLRVPAGQFRVAWDGKAPRNESTWGESHEAWQMPLYAGGRAMAYSPFSTTEESSVDFVALQISRAVEAVYGRTIPYEEIRDRYLEPTPDGGARLRNPAGLTLLEDYPELHAGGEGPIFPVVLMLTGLLYLILAMPYFRTFRASVSHRARMGAFFAMLGATLVLHVAPFVAFVTGLVEDWVVLGLAETGIRWLAGVLPGGALAVWLLCALILGAGYRWSQGAFARIDVPLPRPTPVA